MADRRKPRGERRGRVDVIRSVAAAVSGAEAVAQDAAFASLGVDSIGGVELRRAVGEALSAAVPPDLLGLTARTLADRLHRPSPVAPLGRAGGRRGSLFLWAGGQGGGRRGDGVVASRKVCLPRRAPRHAPSTRAWQDSSASLDARRGVVRSLDARGGSGASSTCAEEGPPPPTRVEQIS